jgi:hypothetical protein
LANLSQFFPILSDLKCYRIDLAVIKHCTHSEQQAGSKGRVVSGVKTKLEPLLLAHLKYKIHYKRKKE